VSVGGRPDGNGHPRRRHAHAPGKADMSRPAAKAPRELAQDGIAVSAMLPSVIATDMLPALRERAPRGAPASASCCTALSVIRDGLDFEGI